MGNGVIISDPIRLRPQRLQGDVRVASVPDIPKEFLDPFATGSMTGEEVEAIMANPKKAVIERAVGIDMNHHPGAAEPARALQNRAIPDQASDGFGKAAVRFSTKACIPSTASGPGKPRNS